MKRVKERLLSLRLMEHIQKQPALAARLGIRVTVSGKPVAPADAQESHADSKPRSGNRDGKPRLASEKE